MSEDVGPGTRLLCVEGKEWPNFRRYSTYTGQIYTCLVLHDVHPGCGCHGPDCQAPAVALQEMPPDIYDNGWFCLARFRPIPRGPGQFAPLLEVEPDQARTPERVLEPMLERFP